MIFYDVVRIVFEFISDIFRAGQQSHHIVWRVGNEKRHRLVGGYEHVGRSKQCVFRCAAACRAKNLGKIPLAVIGGTSGTTSQYSRYHVGVQPVPRRIVSMCRMPNHVSLYREATTTLDGPVPRRIRDIVMRKKQRCFASAPFLSLWAHIFGLLNCQSTSVQFMHDLKLGCVMIYTTTGTVRPHSDTYFWWQFLQFHDICSWHLSLDPRWH